MPSYLRPEKFSFTPAARLIAFNHADFDPRKIISIVNRSTGDMLYAPSLGAGYLGTFNGRQLTLAYDTTAMSATDILDVLYDWETSYSTIHEMSFHTVVSGGCDPNYVDLLCQGVGMTVSQTAGKLVVGMGTTTSTETIFCSKVAFSYDLLAQWQLVRSQANANNNVYVMLADIVGKNLDITSSSATSATVTVPASSPSYPELARMLSVNPVGLVGAKMFMGALTGITGPTGNFAISAATLNAGVSVALTFTVAGFSVGTGTCMLYGWNSIYTLETPATATTQTFDCFRYGWPSSMGTTAVTVNTSITGHGCAIARFDSLVTFADSVITAGMPMTGRAHRVDGCPLKEVPLYLMLVLRNGATAPTATTVTISGVRVEESDASPVMLSQNRTANIAPAALPVVFPAAQAVTVTGTISSATLVASTNLACDVGRQYRATATGAASAVQVLAAASTNATIVKAAAGRVLGWNLTNCTATTTLFVKLHNIATAPTAGTGVVRTIAIPPHSVNNCTLEGGIGFATGIGYTTTAGYLDTDTAALTAAGDIVGTIFYA